MTGELKDVLAGRTEDEEAMCAVCSGGLSIAPNLIVFCERCDIAVHQQCYGVDDIPAGELMMGGGVCHAQTLAVSSARDLCFHNPSSHQHLSCLTATYDDNSANGCLLANSVASVVPPSLLPDSTSPCNLASAVQTGHIAA